MANEDGNSLDIDLSGRPSAGRLAPAVRLAVAGCAVALGAFGLIGYATPGALQRPEYWWITVLACAALPIAATAGTAWMRAGLVAATFMAGFGAQLSIRDPLWFQRVSVRPSSEFSYIVFGVIALQGLTAAWIWQSSGTARQMGRVVAALGPWRVLLVAAVLFLASRSVMLAVASNDAREYVVQLIVALTFLGLNLASFVALLTALPERGLQTLSARVAATISLPGGGDEARRFDRVFLACVAGATFAVCSLVALLAMDAIPLLDDSHYRFQARYFARGMVALPLPPSPEAFHVYLLDSYGDRWFSTTFPGWPMALALVEPWGLSWLLNPLLAAGSILMLHRFVRAFTDRGTANLAAFLMAVSPWYLSMSATQLLHTFTYALILGAWLLLMKARERPSVVLPLLAGGFMGWLFLTRPLEGALMGVLTGLWTLTFLKERRQWKTVISYALGCIAVGAAIFPYNAYLTGNPLSTPITVYLDRLWGPGANSIGFGPNRGAVPRWGELDALPGHSPLEALINIQQNLQEVQVSFLGWGGASLVFALIYMVWGKWTRFTTAMALICILTIALYSLYWFVGGFYAGARYWFLALVPLLIFTALGIVTCARKFAGMFPEGMAAQRIGVGIAFLGFCSIFVFESWLAFNRYPEYNGYHADYYQMSRQDRFRDSLIFIRSEKGVEDREYGSAFWLNDFAEGAHSPIFARDLGAASNREIAAAYPDRKIYFVDGRSKQRPRVTVTRGPLTFGELEQGPQRGVNAVPGG